MLRTLKSGKKKKKKKNKKLSTDRLLNMAFRILKLLCLITQLYLTKILMPGLGKRLLQRELTERL